jgi:hypothetical protein
MASVLKVDTLTGVTTAGSISVTGEGNSTTTNLQQGLAKAWVYFQGTGTVTSRDSLNVASLTDNATGDFTITYTSAYANDDYVPMGSNSHDDPSSELSQFDRKDGDAAYQSTSAHRGESYYVTSSVNKTNYDYSNIGYLSHGDLA